VPPFWIAWIEDQWVVVSRETMCPEDIQVGDVLVSMDGRAMADIESEASLMVPAATPQGLKFNLPGVLLNKNVDSAQLVIQKPNGELRSLLVPWNGQTPYGTYPEPRPASPLTELKPGIWYLDLDRITDLSKLQAVISQLAQAKGLVIDMRGYPTWGVWRELFGHLSANAMTSIPFIIPTPTRPDHPREFTSYFTNTLPVSAPTFSAKVVFLTDGRAISQAEFVMAMAAGYHLGEIVGESTAGTDGNINPFDLPGGYSVWWTGMEVRNVDGSKHFQVGIQPTVPCQRTLAGMRAGKDELLEKALSLLP
jgi:hypothetical protein